MAAEQQDNISVLKQLMARKDDIEDEIKSFQNVLETQNVGMTENLVDKDGFPRSDVDVHTIRIARNRIICLKNDLNSVMKEIEIGLHKVHAMAKEEKINTEENMDTDEVDKELKPFLKVDLVSQNSPAEKAGLQVNDIILKFGSINAQNFKDLQTIGSLVQNSRGQSVPLIVKREDTIKNLKLNPNVWSGRGLLGCNIIIMK